MNEIIKLVDEIAKNNGTISNKFKPSEDGLLGRGRVNFVYKGVYTKTGETIAMKFFRNGDEARKELDAYYALGAYNNQVENIEAYGVPKLHDYGMWTDFAVIGITFLDSEFEQILKRSGGTLQTGDILILFREVVRILKYINGRGICHEDLAYHNIMFRNNLAFIIDYEKSKIVQGGSKKAIKCITRAWMKLLEEISSAQFGKTIEWNGRTNTINQYKDKVMDAGVKKVFLELIKTAYDTVPNYDKVYKIIIHQIDKHFNGTAFVSWLRDDQKEEAKKIKIPAINTIHFE